MWSRKERQKKPPSVKLTGHLQVTQVTRESIPLPLLYGLHNAEINLEAKRFCVYVL